MIIGQFLKGEIFSSETVFHSAINRGNRSGNRIGRNFLEGFLGFRAFCAKKVIAGSRHEGQPRGAR
jgi:hypothetical protein